MQETYKNYTIEIEQSDIDCNPREWDNLATMYYRHRDYILGDETIPNHFYNDNGEYIEIDSYESFKEWRELQGDEIVYCEPLEIYDHSGITIWIGHNPQHPDYRWDCSHVGYIVITKQDIRKNWNVKRVTKKLIDQAIEQAENEVKVFDQYLTGDIWGYSVTDKNGDHIDSCGGFFGYDECLSEAKSAIDYHIEHERKQRIERLKQYIKSGVGINYRFI